MPSYVSCLGSATAPCPSPPPLCCAPRLISPHLVGLGDSSPLSHSPTFPFHSPMCPSPFLSFPVCVPVCAHTCVSRGRRTMLAIIPWVLTVHPLVFHTHHQLHRPQPRHHCCFESGSPLCSPGWPRNSQRSACLYIVSAGMKGPRHPAFSRQTLSRPGCLASQPQVYVSSLPPVLGLQEGATVPGLFPVWILDS